MIWGYKKFPLKKILNSKDFYLKYINQKNDLLQNVNFVELNKIISLLKKCFKSGKILYTCGNGGSSSLAEHFTCDFIKQTNNETKRKQRRKQGGNKEGQQRKPERDILSPSSVVKFRGFY